MKKRIWELDALRGLFLWMMVAIHFTYDLVVLYDAVDLKNPALFNWSLTWGGSVFLVISGVSATLGSRPVRRGLQVFGCGMVITVVTAGMYFLDLAEKEIIIYFGVLQCLGCCMLLWPLFRHLPAWALGALGLMLSSLGLYLLQNVRVSFDYLAPLGLTSHRFASSDYFPLLPNFGYFLVGSAIGKALYKTKTSRLPKVNTQSLPIRFFLFSGRHSLLIYMLHQPILAGLIGLVLLVLKETV